METDKVLVSANTLLRSCKGCSVLSEEQTVSLSAELSAVRRVLDKSSEELSDERKVTILTIYAQLCDTWMQLIGKPAMARLESVDLDTVAVPVSMTDDLKLMEDADSGEALSKLSMEQLMADSKAKSERLSLLTKDVNTLLAALSQQESEISELYALVDAQKGHFQPQATTRQLMGDVSPVDDLQATVPLSEALRVADTHSTDALLGDGLSVDALSVDATSVDSSAPVPHMTFFDDRLSVASSFDIEDETELSLLVLSTESQRKLNALKTAVSSKKLERSDTRGALLLLSESDEQTAMELEKSLAVIKSD